MTLTHEIPVNYIGRILDKNYTQDLHRQLKKQIAAYTSLEQLDLPIIPYIAAWNIDKKGIWYEYVSKRFLDLFDTDAEHLITKFCDAIVDRREYQEQNDILPDINESTLKSEEIAEQRKSLREKGVKTGHVEAVYKVSVPGKKELWLKDFAAVTSWPQDSVCLSPGYLVDVSKEMSQKDQIHELNVVVNRDKELLVKAERHAALGQVSAQVFHEIRNPIASIGGLAKRLIKKTTATDPMIFIEVIAKEADRLEKILDNLFHYTSQVELDFRPVNPLQLIKNAISLLRSDLNALHIHISLQTSGTIRDIEADQNQLQMALVQIIKNAIEAMDEEGELGINVEMDDQSLKISIRDTGIGIRPAHRKKVTEPFFTTKVYGTGLGLSLAEKAVQLHNGHLTFNRLRSGNTEVVLYLPI